MSDAELLFDKYGPLLTLGQLAVILDRSSEGLRISLRNSSEFSRKINECRLRHGRRVYFATRKIAAILVAE